MADFEPPVTQTRPQQSTTAWASCASLAASGAAGRLSFPDAPGLRPTPDRVRETLFNWLAPYVEGAKVLDPFAGSGALFLEALSRGAAMGQALDASTIAISSLRNTSAPCAAPTAQVADGRRPALSGNPAGRTLSTWCSSTRRSIRTCCPPPARCWKSAAGWRTTPGSTPKAKPRRRPSACPANWRLHREKKAGQVHYALWQRSAVAKLTFPGSSRRSAWATRTCRPCGDRFGGRPLTSSAGASASGWKTAISSTWTGTARTTQTCRSVLVLHGLTGSSNSPYVAGLQHAMEKRGWASVALNWRGCSGEPNLLPRSYHSGASEDLAAVIDHLRKARPLAPLYAVGYSLGGNMLLKHLGETGHRQPPARRCGGVGAVSSGRMRRPYRPRVFPGFTRRHFMREMVGYIKDKQRHFQHEGLSDGLAELAALGSLKDMRTFWDFDGRVTAPLNGFVDAHDYYRRASSRYFLGAIRTPTLLIQSLDDPFVFKHSLPASR